MNEGRTVRREWLWPVLFLIVGVAGVLVASRLFFRAFPEASVDLRLDKSEIARRSNDFLRGRGFNTAGYRQITVFDFDDTSKTYLERELGLEEANRAMATRVNMWRWQTRLIRPPEKEEFSVWLGTTGTLVGFEHLVDEKRPGARLSRDEAQRVAEVFLRAERRVDLASFKLVVDEAKTRPGRLDYTFTWKERGFRLKDATRRMSVTVLGDQVGGFREFLKIPEKWTRDYEKLRSLNNLLGVIATVLYILLLVGAAITLARSVRVKKIAWHALLAIGGVVGALIAIGAWNDFGLQLTSVPTNFPYETWAAIYTVIAVLSGIFSGLLIVVVLGAGEPLYRELAPDRVSLAHLFTFRGMRSREFFNSTLIGYGMAGMHIGLVTLFYVVARNFGAWAPLDVKYNNAISTAAPWLYPLSTSVFAASDEEFTFRLLAIPLLLSWFRSKRLAGVVPRSLSTWLAVLIPAFLWGFLHSSYPQQPAWIRGVEVGTIGVVAGWVFLRFGILATLVWHYTVDAVLIGLFLLRSDNPSFKIAGALVGDAVLVPLVVAVVFLLQSRGFLKDPSILNRAMEAGLPPLEETPPVVAAATGAEARPFALLSRPALMRLAIAGLAGLVIVALVKTAQVGEDIEIRVGPAAADATATAYLRRLGVDPGAYRRVTYLRDEIPGIEAEYLRERMSAKAMAQLYRDELPSVAWRTRFFRPLAKEEYVVYVAPDGSVQRYVHQLDEKAPGARLDEATALARADSLLAAGDARPRVNLADYDLMEHNVEARDARTDHTLVWEAKRKIAGEATHRITAAVRGDEVTGPQHRVKVPEEWERAHTRPSPFTILPVVLFSGLGLAGLGFFVRDLRRATIHWRTHAGFGALAAALQLVQSVNAIPSWSVRYATSVPWSNAMTTTTALNLMQILFAFVGIAGLGAIAETLLSARFGALSLWPARGPDRGRALLQGLAAGTAAALVIMGVKAALRAGLNGIASPVRGLDSGLPAFPVSFIPALAGFAQLLIASLWATFVTAALAGLMLKFCRSSAALAFALILGAGAVAAGGALSGVHFVKLWSILAVSLGLIAVMFPILRFNLAAWLTLNVVSVAVGRIASGWRHEGLRPYALQTGIGLAIVIAAMVAWGLRASRPEAER